MRRGQSLLRGANLPVPRVIDFRLVVDSADERPLAANCRVGTYKFALLLALADLAIENGDDSGALLTLATDEIAEKYIQYYWRQVVPYLGATTSILQGVVLRLSSQLWHRRFRILFSTWFRSQEFATSKISKTTLNTRLVNFTGLSFGASTPGCT